MANALEIELAGAMILPNANCLIVAKEKVIEYLLNLQHPDGASKARFFGALGFEPERWEVLADSLCEIGRTCAVVKSVASTHGHKYIVDGDIAGPNRRSSSVRTIWIIDQGEQTPRLVTAYPAKQRS